MSFRIIRRGRSFWASSRCGNVVADHNDADPSRSGAVIVVPDPDFVPPTDAPHTQRALSLFVPIEILREMMATLDGR